MEYEASSALQCRVMTGEFGILERIEMEGFNTTLFAEKLVIASKVLASASYEHAIDIGIDRIKESEHWGERPEKESYIEEKLKEYFLDKIREPNE